MVRLLLIVACLGAGAATAQTGSAERALFERLAGAPIAGFELPNTARAGPVIVEYARFFPGAAPQLWLRTYLQPIPYLDLADGPVIEVGGVLDASGASLRDDATAGAPAQAIELDLQLTPRPHLVGVLPVALKAGTKELQVEKISGTLRLALPVDVSAVGLVEQDVGAEKKAGAARLKLDTLRGEIAELTISEGAEQFLGVRGFDAAGESIAPRLRAAARLPEDQGKRRYRVHFGAAVARIDVLFAGRRVEQSFPFTLTRGAVAATVPDHPMAAARPRPADIAAAASQLAAAPAPAAPVQAAAESPAKARAAAKAKAEDAARDKAEAVKQAKAEAQAKAKAEQQAKAEAAKQAKAEAQAKAKAAAEEKARHKAEAQAKAKAEQQAKAEAAKQAKAEAQAKAKAAAEEKARHKAEAQAKAKAEQKAEAASKPETVSKPQAPAGREASAKPPAQAAASEAKPSEAVRATAAAQVPERAAPDAAAAAPASTQPRFNDLVTAVWYRDREAAQQLLDLGKWVDRTAADGRTPLMHAVRLRDEKMVELLIARGADPNASGPAGVTPLSIARAQGDRAIETLLRKAGAR